MTDRSERFGYSDASRAEREINLILRERGMEAKELRQMVILGSGFNNFPADYMEADKIGDVSGPVRIPFNWIYGKLNGVVGSLGDAVPGHDRSLIIGPMKGSTDGSLVVAQSGREHPYEGVSMQRATFWLRVMQLMGVQDLIGSNAAGILTPQTLKKDSIMLVHSDKDFGDDSPLRGHNDERFGPRFPHRGDDYPVKIRDMAKRLAQNFGIDLQDGTYFREPGPNYESTAEVYSLRGVLRMMWNEGCLGGDMRFRGEPRGVVGMSSTYENMVAQQASQTQNMVVVDGKEVRGYPAFRNRIYLSALTNYAAMLGPNGLITDEILEHSHVKDSAKSVSSDMGRLINGVFLELRKEAA